MKTTQSNLRRIIQEEITRVILTEGCGCGCGGVGGCSAAADEQPQMFQHDSESSIQDDQLSKGEALELVTAIAGMTTCPVTQKALLDVVDNLSDSEPGEEWNLGDEEDIAGAFGDGVGEGEQYRDSFSYTGDLPDDPSDARELGYTAGLLGLSGG